MHKNKRPRIKPAPLLSPHFISRGMLSQRCPMQELHACSTPAPLSPPAQLLFRASPQPHRGAGTALLLDPTTLGHGLANPPQRLTVRSRCSLS